MEPTTLTNQNPDPEPLAQQNIFFFDLFTGGRQHKIKFNSAFDSGNMRQVTSSAPFTYIVQTAPDCCGTKYEGFSKSWYYFGVSGVPKGTTLNFVVKKISILYQMYKSAPEAYKPVCKIGDGGWKRIEEKAVIMEGTEDKGLEVRFSYTFDSEPNEEVFFAFTYPFSYEESQKLLEEYDIMFQKDADIYYHREIITRSVQERDIDLVTISSHEGKLRENESDLHEELFPNKLSTPRARKFRNNKPVVLLTARVHPGETPASHTMNGILKFLLDKKDVRAQLLRQYFVFMLVPMINPDGVYNGHYRMDTYNQNLNRYYKCPDSKKHPAIFAIKELVQYLHMESRLFFYCDLHAHAAKKGCFLYGNALDFVMQVETILFAKVMSVNCINFEFDSCNFSKKQMNSRDKGEKLTKEGAGRVAIHKICNLIHSYTMECGLHFSNELNRIAAPTSTKNCFEDHISDINSEIYKDSPTYYSIEIYENLGKGMLVSILDIFHKNPATRMSITSGVTIENMRKEIASRVVKIHRFWKEAHVKRKCLKINEIIKELFYDEFDKKNVFSVVFSSERKLYSASASMKRLPQNVLTQSVSLGGKIDKKMLSDVVAKVKEEQNMVVNDWAADENVENVENLVQMAMVKSLPKLANGKTPIALRDFRLKHNEARALQFEAKPGKEEVLPTISTYESKLSFHPNLRVPEKGILVYTKADVPVPSVTDLNTPTRANLAIRERRNLQNHSQQPSLDNLSIRGGKRSTIVKKNQSTIPKGCDTDSSSTVPLEPFIYMNATGHQPSITSGNTNSATSAFQANFFVVGKPNYIIAKGKLKSSIGNMHRKTKGN